MTQIPPPPPAFSELHEHLTSLERAFSRVTTARHPSGRRRTREVIWRRIAAEQQITPTLWDHAA